MNIAILTSDNQWFVPYAQILSKQIQDAKLFYNHQDIIDNYDIVFILSYHKIIAEQYLKLHKHNIVIHASKLPEGKGWSPLFWQVLEGKNEIPFTMFEALNGMDDGDIYMQDMLELTGYELNQELRQKQAEHTIKMCLNFLVNYDRYKIPMRQLGKESFYSKRNIIHSKLDIDKTIKEQFNLLRIVNNNNYPAFFIINKQKYKLTIEKKLRSIIQNHSHYVSYVFSGSKKSILS